MVERLALLGREREVEELRRFLDAVPSGPIGLLLEGDAGIGKTSLWREAVSSALDRSYSVLVCRPGESEAQLAFSALGDLLDDVLESASENLPMPQRRALEIALLRAEAEGPSPLPRAVSLGALGVVRALAASGPVVLAVDDVQWLDRPSASTLEFVARRLRAEPIGFMLARRGVEATAPLDLDQALPGEPVRRLLVGPLRGDALELLVRGRLDMPLGQAAFRQLETACGGNPYFALELARSLAAREFPLGPGEPLPVPGSLRTLLGERLADLAAETYEAVLAASALARPTVAFVEASLRSSDPAAALAGALDAGVLERDGDRLRFTHPLIASVVYADAPAAQRCALHARIAEAVEESEEQARHLALASEAPDAEVAASLDRAARSVRARGAPADAAQLFEEARRLTPSHQVDDAARRAVDAAECHFEGGDFGRVCALLEEVTGVESSERARALAFLGWVRAYQEGFTVGADIFRAALEAVGPDLQQRIEIERGLAWSLHELGQLRDAEIHSRAALEMAERLGEPSTLARAIADMAFHDAATGRGDPLARIESALVLDEPGEWQTVVGRPRWVHALILEWRGELELAGCAFDEMHRSAVDRGDEHSLPYMLFHLARIEILRGRFESADLLARLGTVVVALRCRGRHRRPLSYPRGRRVTENANGGAAMAASEATIDLPALSADAREEAGRLLQLTLVELIALSLIGKQLHWNITGTGFRDLHLQLDELVDEWRELSDVVAERAVAIGFSPDGRAPTVIAQSELEPVEPGQTPIPEAIRQLTRRVADVDERARERCEQLGEIDLASQDVLIEVTRGLEKQLWMIRSQL